MKTNDSLFNEAYVLHELVHFLPSQTPLKDFIHHNTLPAFQGDKFYDAIFKASKMAVSSSAITVLKETGIPKLVKKEPIQAAFVLMVCPISNSSPILMISAFI